MNKHFIERVYNKLGAAMDRLEEGEYTFSDFGDYVYQNLANDILNILGDLIEE